MKKVLDKHGIKAVMLFIAELNGFKSGTPKAKAHYGLTCWLSGKLHDLDYTDHSSHIKSMSHYEDKPITSKQKADLLAEEAKRLDDVRSEAHENIWLTRLYTSLDSHFNATPIIKTKALTARSALVYLASKHLQATHLWDVPLELDASASMLQYIGLLTNDERLLSMTNVIGSTLSDPWAFNGIPRTQFKHAATPMLYGSSKPCHELWQDKKHKYTLEQIKLFNDELATGALSVANAFKEFLITNVKPTETMHPTIFNETFQIECNRYKHIGDTTTKYDIYDTETDSIRRITHTTTRKEADLEQFRRYFVTLLIHNLDSQVANAVISKVMDKYNWGIDIHDAFIVHPNAARDVRKWYSQELTNIYNNRTSILTNYFKSINIGPEAQAHWDRVKSLVQPVKGAFKANLMALK